MTADRGLLIGVGRKYSFWIFNSFICYIDLGPYLGSLDVLY